MVKESMNELSMSKFAIEQVIRNFTNLSKQKYILIRNDDEDDADTN